MLTRTTAVVAALATATLLALPALSPADAATKPYRFKNCTALHKKFPHGVGTRTAKDHVAKGGHPVTSFTRSNAWYTANRALDRDKDGIACEAR